MLYLTKERKINMVINIYEYLSEDSDNENKLYISKENLLDAILNKVQEDNPNCEVEYDNE